MPEIIRVFPRQTSLSPPAGPYVFYGPPPMQDFRPVVGEVHVSCTFTWDKAQAEYLAMAWQQYYADVQIGGPAYANPCDTFVPGRYVREGVTFTSRGCNNNCPWCLVPVREGRLAEIRDFSAGHIVQDNNLAQCSWDHLDRVFAMLAHEKDVQLSGGIEARLITTEFVDRLRGLHLGQIFLACDTAGSLKHLQQAMTRLGMPRHGKVRCFVLLAHNGETISDATARLEDVWATGAIPHAQLYQPDDEWLDYPRDWLDLNRTWSRPAIMRTMHKEKARV